MSNLYHTPITTGAAANASVVNAPLGQLDGAITTAVAQAQLAQDAVINAGTAATLADGAANAAQKVVTVDSSSMMVAGATVEYMLVGGVAETNTIDTVDSGTQITLTANIGTGGIGDNALIAVVPITYANLKAGIYNAKDFGASPAASAATNTTAIQAAITAATNAKTGIVNIPPGVYEINALTLPIDDSDICITIRGAGPGYIDQSDTHDAGTRLMFQLADGTEFISAISTSSSQPTYIFENFSVDGPDDDTSTTSGDAIKITGTGFPRVYMRNVHITRFGGGVGLYLGNVYNCHFDNVWVRYCDTGMRLEMVNACVFDNCTFEYCHSYGSYLDDASTSVYNACTWQSNEKTGLYIVYGVSIVFNACHFENNNTSSTASKYAAHLAASVGHPVQGIHFNHCHFNTAADQCYAEGTVALSVYGIVWNHCYMALVDTPAIEINGNSLACQIIESADITALTLGGAGHFVVFWGRVLTSYDARAGLIVNEDGNDVDTRIEGNTDPYLIFCNAGDDRVGIGEGSLEAKLHIDQTGAAAAIPPLRLDQADVDQDFIEFSATVGEGNAIEAVGAKTLTTTHFIKVTITGVGERYIPLGTIAA